ncbi:hypothetical protein [Alkaliphilus sp. B6464]|uniref:hypothetical protein n=1 Tax=Alkaliphilus sp. B6464 TaxID=2731219 RepID=UPI001BA52542|nr:hypothetical protein [Alkaliphilus sp. B6464]QUH18438.1 hypothetical protein HYG84_16980 [Alkaliphilus sp. B6464]
MRKTALGCTILEGNDIADLPLVSENSEILEAELAKKVDKVAGKGLSTNDYTTAEKTKLTGIATGANNYTHPSSHPISFITGLQSALDAKETPSGAQSKVDAHANLTNPHNQYVLDTEFATHLAEMATEDTAGHIKLSDIPTPPKGTRIARGTYTGNDVDRRAINVGFMPMVFYVVKKEPNHTLFTTFYSDYTFSLGVNSTSNSSSIITISSTGVILRTNSIYMRPNESGASYEWFAIG